MTGSERARLLKEFEIFHTVDGEGVLEHHDSSASVVEQFLNKVKIFLGAMDGFCNPFLDESFNLYYLDTKVAVEQNVTGELMQVEHTGKKQLLNVFKQDYIKQHAQSPTLYVKTISHFSEQKNLAVHERNKKS